MARPRRHGSDLRLAVAFLAAKRWKQAAIAEFLQLTTGTVSKFIGEARRTGRLTEIVDVRFITKGLSQDRLRRIQSLAEPTAAADHLRELAARSGKPAPVVRVFTGAAAPGQGASTSKLEQFSRDAADHLATLLRGAHICGVSWGATLKALVDAIERTSYRPKRRRPVTFIPVAGEPLGKAPTAISASTLAQRLDEIINGDSHHRHSVSLAGVPAFVPRDLLSGDLPAIDRLFGFVDGYRAVFGSTGPSGSGPSGHIEQMDTLLTSLGPLGRPFGPSGSDLLTAAKLESNELSELAVAEISGVLLERDRLSPDQQRALDEIRARWRGIRDRHLTKCVLRAARSGRPGVILVGVGRNRLQGVIEAVARGLVSQVLIDRELAAAIGRERAGFLRRSASD